MENKTLKECLLDFQRYMKDENLLDMADCYTEILMRSRGVYIGEKFYFVKLKHGNTIEMPAILIKSLGYEREPFVIASPQKGILCFTMLFEGATAKDLVDQKLYGKIFEIRELPKNGMITLTEEMLSNLNANENDFILITELCDEEFALKKFDENELKYIQ